jgi:alpha-tubulin suppressor-like RCC1 family protein
MTIEFDDGTKFDNANPPASSAFTENYAGNNATTDIFNSSTNTNYSGSSLGWSDGTWYCPFHIDCGSGFTKKVKRVTIINGQSDYQYSLIVPRLYGASSVPSTPGLAANWNYVCHVESIQRGWTSETSSYDTEPTAYRYIGISGYRTTYSTYIYEFSIELVDGTVYDSSNIPTVSSNMTVSGGLVAQTIDGIWTSWCKWNNASTYTSASQQYVYLKVDLGSAKKVKHVRVWSNYTGTYTNGPNSMNYYGSSTNTSSVNAEGSSDWNRLGPIEMLKSNDTTEQTINSSLYDSKLEFDGYNKLSLNKFDPTSSTLKYFSNTYDLGTISTAYIAKPGTYSAEIKGSTNFALSSNVTGNLGTYSTLHDNVAISHTTGGGQTLVTVNNIKGNMTYKISFNKQWTDSHGSYSTRLKMYIRDSNDDSIREINSIGDYLNNPRDGILLYDGGGSFDESAMVVGTGFSIYGGAGTHTVGITGGTYGSTRSPFTLADPWYFLITMSTSNVITGKFFVGDTEVISHFETTAGRSGDTGTIGETGNKFVFEFHSTATISGVNMTVEEYNPAPKLDFDGYNKLTFSGLESGTTSNVLFNGNTYSIGTASNVYIENTGTYEAESKGTTTFALTSNVVSGSIIEKPYNATSIVSWTNLGTTLTSDTNNITFSGYVDWDTTGTVSTSFDSTNNAIVFGGGNVGLQADFTSLRSDRNSNLWVEYEVYVTSGNMRSMLGIGKSGDGENDWFHWHDYRVYVWGANVGTGWNVPTGQWVKLAWKSDYIGSGNRRVSALLDSGNGYEEIAYHTGAPMGAGSNYLHSTGVLSYIRLFYTAGTTGASTTGNKIRNIHIFYDQSDVPTAPPSLTFDGFNKYTFTGADTNSTYKLKYESNTYDLGTISNVYIANPGTYSAEIKGATNFGLSSNVVSGTIPPYKTILKIQDILGTVANELFGFNDYEGTGCLAFSKDGTRLAVGCWMYNSQQGRVYIYTLSGGQYVLDSGMPLEGGSGQHMGYAINFNDDGTKIGLGSANGLGAKVYERSSSGSWSLRDSFGSGSYWTKGVVLDASGDRALGGASGDNTLKLFDWNGSSAYTETTTFSGSNSFGNGFDMTRDGLTVIGINKNSGNETVKAWKYASGSWSQMGSDIDVGAMTNMVNMARGTGTRFVVSNHSNNSSTGILKLYEYSGSSWSKIQEWTGYTSGVGLGIDHSISDDGTIIIAGSYTDDTGSSGNDAGMFSIFTETNGTWEEKRFFGDTDGDQLGQGVTMSYDGGFYVASAPSNDEAASNAGKVRIYQNKNVLDFDGYNKLTFSGLESGTTSNVLFNGNTYSIGTASNVYIENTGTYEAESTSASTFALTSNVVGSGSINSTYPPVFTPVQLDADPVTDPAPSNPRSFRWQYTNGTKHYYRGYNGNTIDSGPMLIYYDTSDKKWYDGDTADHPNSFVVTTTQAVPSLSGSTDPSSATGTSNAEYIHCVRINGTHLFSFKMAGWVIPTNPSLTFDGYKLVVSGITQTSSTLKYESNTYDIGSATNVYIKDVGTYTAEIGNATDFVFTSNVVSSVAQIEPVITGAYSTGHALTYDGKLYAWGSQGEGGAGTSPDSPEDWSNVPTPTLAVKNPNSSGTFQGEIVSIWNQSKRGQSRWAKTRDGRIWLTGDRQSYCTPFDAPGPAGAASSGSGDLKNFTDVSLYFGDHTQTSNSVVWASGSERATQVLMENGDVWSFGNDSGAAGILGQGASATSDHTPRKLSGISNVTKIANNGDLVMALDSSNVVWMWGSNDVGHGSPNWGAYNVPTNIMGTGTANLTGLLVSGETVTDIECGSYSMFVITSKGTVYATGKNGSGQLGQGGTTAKSSSDGWVKIDYFTTNAITVNRLYTGQGEPHVFADTSDGWYCWGENGSGQLGLGDTADKTSPVKFTGVSNIKVFGTVENGCYAITEDGKYYAWGDGSNYTRGDNATGAISYPKYIDTLPNILAPSFEFDGYDKVFVNKVNTDTEKYKFNIPSVIKLTGGTWDNQTLNTGTSSTSTKRYYSLNGTSTVDTVFTLDITTGILTYAVNSSDTGGGSPTAWSKVGFNTSNSSDGDSINAGDTIYLVQSSGSVNNGYFTVGADWVTEIQDNVKYTKGTTTYDVGKASIITVPDTGTYDAQIKSGTDFSLKSATVPATSTTGLYTWAFHHGNFDNAYGDGDILTARDNGRFYADTPAYTGAIGTITPGATTTSNTTYTFASASALTANVMMVAGGGGGGRVQYAGGGGAGGLVYTAGTSLANGATKTIVVGNGGLIGGDSGNDTTFTNLTTAVKGGYGGDSTGIEPQDGGSGGGQAYSSSTTSSGTAGQGYGGGGKSPATADESGGGGGGAGEAGHDGWIVGSSVGDGRGGNGGKGKFFGTGSSDTNFGGEYGDGGWFAGGGGGGTIRTSWSGLPGKGGGGRGYGVLEYKPNDDLEGVKGFHHTGGGGGGGGWSGKDGGGGGSGIVLIQTNVPTPRVNTNVGVSNDYYIHALIEDSQTHTSYRRGAGGNGHSSGGYHDNIRKADGSLGRVYRATANGNIHIAGADSLVSTVEGIFYPIEQERYDNILEIGHNSTHDVELEMASDGTAKLYRNNGGTHLATSTEKCFTAGKWHHIVLTLDANRNAVAYVNGYPVVSTTYSSAILPGSRTENCIYRTGVGATFRKFMFYYFKTYNSVLNQNQIMKLASSVGLGPKLEYDGLNTLKILNTEPGSTVRLFTSNVADTSNVYIVADPAAGEYKVPEAGKYYAEIKGTDTFTITKTLDVGDPLYAYPPRDGTHGDIDEVMTADTWSTWTISGASYGNGNYKSRSNHTCPSSTRTSYSAFKNDITPGAGEHTMGAITGTRHLDLQLPSAKTMRKYIVWLTDSAFYTGNVTTTYTQYDPIGTMAYNGNERGVRRIKSWTIQGSNNDVDWTTIHTVTNKPPSNYGDIHTISSPGSYQYYRIAVTEHMGSSQVTMIGELVYYGD